MFQRQLYSEQIAEGVASLINKNNNLGNTYNPQYILSKQENYIVETLKNEVVGCAALEKMSYVLSELKHISVAKPFRKMGIAKNLVTCILARARTPFIYATVREDNIASQNLLLSCGFLKISKYRTETRSVILFLKIAEKWK